MMRSWTTRISTAVMFAAVVLLPSSGACEETCPMQVYTVPDKEPNYDCPSPQESVLIPDLPAKSSTGLKLGQAAPFDGVLLDKDRLLVLGLRIKALRRIRYVETISSAQTLKAEVAYQQKVGKAQQDLLSSQVGSYKAQLQNAQEELAKERRWYKSWTFGVVVGVVVTAAGATALGYALRK